MKGQKEFTVESYFDFVKRLRGRIETQRRYLQEQSSTLPLTPMR